MSSDNGAGSTLRATPLTEHAILGADYAMIALVSIFVFSRLVFYVARHKKFELQDFLIYLAYAFYLSRCALYIIVTPILFKIQDITTGVLPLPADFNQTAGLVSRLIFSAQLCFYSCLWLVKFSLLCLYKKLLLGLPPVYIWLWWALFVLCFLVGGPEDLLDTELTQLHGRHTLVVLPRVWPRATTSAPSLRHPNVTCQKKFERKLSACFLRMLLMFSLTSLVSNIPYMWKARPLIQSRSHGSASPPDVGPSNATLAEGCNLPAVRHWAGLYRLRNSTSGSDWHQR